MARGMFSGVGLGAGLRPPPAAAPGGLPAPPAASAGHPRRRGRGALPSPCASPSPAPPGPLRRRWQAHPSYADLRLSLDCQGAAEGPAAARESRGGSWVPGELRREVPGLEGAREAGASCTKSLSSRRSPQPLRWLFLTPTTLVLSGFRITPKAPPSPQRHLFRSRFPVPFSPALRTVPRPLLAEPSPGLPPGPGPLRAPKVVMPPLPTARLLLRSLGTGCPLPLQLCGAAPLPQL